MFEDRKTVYYRVNDPLEYLKIGINIREGSKIGKDGEIKPTFSENKVIDWQEKIVGPSEIARYIKSDEDDEHALVSQKEIGRQLKQFEKSGEKASSLLKPTMIYTYIHKDNHIEPTPPSLVDSRGMESYVGTAMSRSSHYNEATSQVDKRSIKVENRSFRDKPYKVMYICLASEVDVEALSSTHHIWDESMYYKNNVLCEMRLYSDGLLEMTPGFSEVCKEPYSAAVTKTHSSRMRSASTEGAVSNATDVDSLMPTTQASKSVFMNNQTIIAGFKTGFRLATYTMRTEDGHLFEYSLENVNALPVVDGSIHHQLLTPVALNTTTLSSKGQQQQQQPQPSSSALGATGQKTGSVAADPHSADMSKWKQDPPGLSYNYTSTLYAEIVSGCGFEGDKLFVTYEILYPRTSNTSDGGGNNSAGANWKLRTGCLTDGVNAKDLLSAYSSKANLKDNVSTTNNPLQPQNPNFSPLEISALVNEKESAGMLNGSTQVANTLDTSGRYIMGSGGAANAVSKNTVSGNKFPDHFHMLHHHGLDPVTRIVLGLLFFIISCLSVVMGISYPFWILPGLIVYFTLGDGMPGGGDILVMNDDHRDAKVFNTASHNVKNKVFQIGASCGITDPTAHFNYLINCSFDVAESAEHRQLRIDYQNLTKANAAYATTTTSTNSANIDTSVDPITEKRSNAVHMGNSQTAPTILFEVYSVGWFGRTRLEGYASSPLPLLGSTGEMEIRTWKPVGSLYSRLYDCYIGCGARLYNSKFTGIVNDRQKSINRFGVVTETSGTIRFKATMITCDPRAVVEVDMAEIIKKQKSKKLKQTAEDIVSHFKSTGSVASGAVNSILLRASSNSNAALGAFGSRTSSRGISPSTSINNAGPLLNRNFSTASVTNNGPDSATSGTPSSSASRMKEILSSNSQANSRIADIMARARGMNKPGSSSSNSSSGGGNANTTSTTSATVGSTVGNGIASGNSSGDGHLEMKHATNSALGAQKGADEAKEESDISTIPTTSSSSSSVRDPQVKVIPRGGVNMNRTIGGGSNPGELKPLLDQRGGKTNMNATATIGHRAHPPPKDRRYNRSAVAMEEDEEDA